ncbi:MAG: transglutaminase domain-containing protein [Prolixibacteraceae bacterium]
MLKTTIKNLLLTVLLFLFFSSVFAQKKLKSYGEIKEEYPHENRIKLKKKIELTITFEDQIPVVREKSYEQFLYLKNMKGFNPELSAYSSEFKKLIEFEANTYVWKNNKYNKLPVKKYNKIKSFDNSTFFDDVEEYVFTFPGIAEGSIVELNTQHLMNDPHFLDTYLVNDFLPVEEYEFVVICDSRIEIEFILKNFTNPSDSITAIKGKKKTIYQFKKQKLEGGKFEKHQSNVHYFTPHIIPIIKSYTLNDKKTIVLNSIESLHRLYSSFLKNLNDNVDSIAIQQIVNQMITSKMNEFEKVEQLYQWVQSNIKYIAIEDGMSGFIPQNANQVLNQRFGDCKGKSNLLLNLINQAGIKAYYTWIGTRDIPYSYSEIYTPHADNHMIVTYIYNNQYYFLDATGNHQTMEIPTSFIQGKEALISIDSLHFEIKTVPVVKAQYNQETDSISLEWDGKELLGKGNKMAQGYPGKNLLYLINSDNQKELKDDLERLLQIGNNKFVLTNFHSLTNDDFAPSVHLQYQFTLNSYISSVEDELFMNMNLNRELLEYRLEVDQQHPFQLDNTISQDFLIKLKIPETYGTEYLPQNTNFSSADFSYSITYAQSKDEITYHYQLKVDKIYFEKTDFEQWNRLINALEKSFKETIILKRSNEN